MVGDRFWKQRLIGSRPSEPQPLERLPLNWNYAFGGNDFARNPCGRGMDTRIDEASGESLTLLPNIETPGALVSGPKQRPEPSGFGPMPMQWPQRWDKIGTYKGNWLRDRWPWYAEDMDPTFFNAAPADQQVPFLRGDESFSLIAQHPKHHEFMGQLPGITPRCVVFDRLPLSESEAQSNTPVNQTDQASKQTKQTKPLLLIR